MSSSDRNAPSADAVAVEQDTVKDGRRREAMRRMAKYAAPAMLALLIAEKAAAQSDA
jgi:hypothetical protein